MDTRTKSVLTWRVAEENNGKSKKWINDTILGAAKKGFKTCFLPNKPRKDDTTGEVPPMSRGNNFDIHILYTLKTCDYDTL